MGTVGVICIALSEVKLLYKCKTNYCKIIYQGFFHLSRTKVGGLKMIIYHGSLKHKLSGIGFGSRF